MIRISDDLRAATARPGVRVSDAVERVVDEIIADVRARGDAAVLAYTQKFDGAALDSLTVEPDEIDAALKSVDGALMDAIGEAAANIRAYHERQRREGFRIASEGILIGQRVLPLKRVGVYVPGGTASYPSTVLMDVIPASVAGVSEICMATPPGADGAVAPAILAAARLAGVTKIYKMGGAQAVAALAYGTESVPAVDKIVGPGNAYVATAKRRVFGVVGIDMIAGPSEILIIADETADARYVAADMLSQAEHDPLAAAILVTTSRALAEAVDGELERQLVALPRGEIARASLAANGRIFVAPTLDAAAALSDEIAPEHLELCVKEPLAWLNRVSNAGSVFLGHYAPEALGDYWAGPNHTLPTGGTARFSSPLGVDDFVRRSSYIQYSAEALGSVHEKIERFALAEGLSAHARAVAIRFEGDA
jgi:histidinol dehydrogenase